MLKVHHPVNPEYALLVADDNPMGYTPWDTSAIAPSETEDNTEDDTLELTEEYIRSLSWRDQKALLDETQQDLKPDGSSWEEWAIAVLVEGAIDG